MLIKYFAYGSNMSVARLRQRVPSACVIGVYYLDGHSLRFHKSGQDGSAKCNVCYTGGEGRVYGVLYEIDSVEKIQLDKAEGLGVGYGEKMVQIYNLNGTNVEAITYYALQIDEVLKPYSWYVNHVVIGAREAELPDEYILSITSTESVDDADAARNTREREIHQPCPENS
ncbi:gamma-glutamylcyclotransferase family protein [Amphritea japonica]|uniref:Gamma-glutamylcyclotransferase AIG2-like domain-containing protein n=1 Tax=Amphritea japonica ATCC BAA-1530 TaxID=1278309 RepID=A0A7R6SS75_9GAMM|nr:gamma-glutamylcyclotransferase family protein [Amphritea japonica]BBB25951.1 conserved hypothetical protein [Amphritea japonica ATCC BAA-1530]